MKFLIVKYAEDHWPEGYAPEYASVSDTYTAKQVGIQRTLYDSIEEAKPDLKKLREFNPTVGYGIISLEPTETGTPK